MRVVFVLRQLGYVRLFDAPIRALLEQGHSVHLLYERDLGTDRERAWLDELERSPRFGAGPTDALRRDPWFVAADRTRRISDYVDALDPAYATAPDLLAQAEDRVHPVVFRRLVRAVARFEPARRTSARALRGLEAVFPPSDAAQDELRALDADVLVVVPHLVPGNRQSEYLRAANAMGLRSVVAVGSWDNLGSKQLLRELPDRLVVWNDVQKQEAVERHGVPPDRVAVTGVQSFDEWFARSPRPRETFCKLVGLDPARPYLLWVGGALFPAALTESEFIRDVWLPRLRSDARFDDVQVLVRPHPRRLPEWEDFESTHDLATWPRPAAAAMPVDDESRADFYDSIFHSVAVVGINTTAMIEAAVVGRSVHTLLLPEFETSQLGTAHFHYLLEVGGGLLEAARTWGEHLDALAGAVAGADAGAARRRAFLEQFVRPYGLDRPALPFFVDALVTTPPARPRDDGAAVRALRAALKGSLALARRALRTARR
jgi:hypothetical protein